MQGTSVEPVDVLVFGAHPDDCDIKAGGVAVKWADAGGRVRFVSLTNGAAGHQRIGGVELSRRRRAEAQAAADVLGIEYDVQDVTDGELEPTVDRRKRIIRTIREFEPDLVLTHRPNDYHPDHRYASKLVQDSAYMVAVPNICTDVRALSYDPVVGYLSDDFQRPYPHQPDAVVTVDDVFDRKVDALHRHESQFYEWLPYVDGVLDDVPEGDADRREWLASAYADRWFDAATDYRDELANRYDESVAADASYVEVFEACEYGGQVTDEGFAALFPK